jgi:hypothetical protein
MIDERDNKTLPLFPLLLVKTDPAKEMRRWAIFDDNRMYRYVLGREWDPSAGRLVCICLNPSTADAEKDDKTTTRIINYARSWGYGSMVIVNLFAYIATDPLTLEKYDNAIIVGNPENDRHVNEQLDQAKKIMIGWGSRPFYDHYDRLMQMVAMIEHRELWCWKIGERGDPYHPLYLEKEVLPQRFHHTYKGRVRKDGSH